LSGEAAAEAVVGEDTVAGNEGGGGNVAICIILGADGKWKSQYALLKPRPWLRRWRVKDLAVGWLGVQCSAEMLKVALIVVRLAELAELSRAVMKLESEVAIS
jgi:hypothetical protein